MLKTTLVPDISLPQPNFYPWILDQIVLLFNIALEKFENNLSHRKLWDIVELAVIIISSLPIKTKPIIVTTTLDKDDYMSQIPNEVKLLIF